MSSGYERYINQVIIIIIIVFIIVIVIIIVIIIIIDDDDEDDDDGKQMCVCVGWRGEGTGGYTLQLFITHV